MGDFNGEYQGIIEEVDLDNANGRCRIRVFGVYGHYLSDQNKIPTNKLPWAYPIATTQFSSKDGSGQLSIPKKGIKVRVTFENGDHMHPRYYACEEIDPVVIDKAKEQPENFHSFFWDTDQDFKFYFTKGSGLMLDYKGAQINIQPNGTIHIEVPDEKSSITLQGDVITSKNDDSRVVIDGNKITAKNKQSNVVLDGDDITMKNSDSTIKMTGGSVSIKNGKTSLKTILNKMIMMYMKTTTIDGKPLSPASLKDAADSILEVNKIFNK